MKLKKLLNKIYSGSSVRIEFYDSEEPVFYGKLGKMTIEQFNDIANRKVYSISRNLNGAICITILDNDGVF